jgi:hypothetical protein
MVEPAQKASALYQVENRDDLAVIEEVTLHGLLRRRLPKVTRPFGNTLTAEILAAQPFG